MERVADILIRFTRHRIRSLESVKACTLAHYQSSTRIQNVAGYFQSKPQEVQLRAIRQLEPELKILLPSETSRFKKLRQKILDLIHQSHQLYESLDQPSSA
jgi:hypothetical protein